MRPALPTPRAAGPLAGAMLLAAALAAPAQSPLPAVAGISVNDNRSSAGQRTPEGLSIRLEVRDGVWRPHGAEGPAIPVMALAERGRPLQNPGPLLRVRTGDWVVATVENQTDARLTVHGLGERTGPVPDSFALPPRGRHTARFRAPSPGTYYYTAVREGGSVILRYEDDSQLNGLLIVDPPEGPRYPDERFFLISWWFQDPDTMAAVVKPALGTMVINGLSWPHTERFRAATGDTLRWRWVNVTEAPHPMHLHGFYFRVDARGNGVRDTIYSAAQQRLAVTERLTPRGTMAITWSPERPGNWLFHCHFAFHISHNVALVPMRDFGAISPHGGEHGMAGLAMGIEVRQRGPRLQPASHRETRSMRLLIQSRPQVYGREPAFAYVLDGAPPYGGSTPLPLPGPTLMLEQNQPVAITLVNQTHEPAAVHWHGIELESFPDGVPGWSGEAGNLLRPIPVGDSLTVRFTPPRAGTFMYHSHFNELQQIASGLYGAILVLPPGQMHDPARDRTLLFSTGGIPTDRAPILLNGEAQPGTIELRAGVTHRLRLVNIMANGGVLVELLRGESEVEWTPVAKDGADLPHHQRTPQPARRRIVAGEIYDFEVTPREPGPLVLSYRGPDRQPVMVSVEVLPAAVAMP